MTDAPQLAERPARSPPPPGGDFESFYVAHRLGDVAQPPWPPTGPDLQFGSAGPGPVVELASVPGPGETGDCSFSTQFTVPNVDPGTYHVLWASGTVNPPSGGDGYAVYVLAGPMNFEVTG